MVRLDRAATRLRGLREAGRAVPEYPTPLNLARILHELEAALPDDAILTTDAGNFATWPTRFMHLQGRQDFLGPTNGAMGYGVPAAIAASLHAPARQVIGFVGDGGFLMTACELATALQFGATPILLVFDNAMFGTIRMHQERRYPGRRIATDLGNPDIVNFARAFGAFAERVETTEAFLPAFEAARASGKAAVLHLICDQAQITTRSRIG